MNEFASLGMFLLLGFILPGLILLTVMQLLFPGFSAAFALKTPGALVGVVLLVSFATCHLPFLLERLILDPLWSRLYPRWRIRERLDIMGRRSAILSLAEARGVRHGHYDQTLGEFVLFTNTAPWIAALALIALVTETQLGIIAAVLLAGSLSTMVFAAPFFKKQTLDILETLESQNRTSHSPEATRAVGESQQQRSNG